MIRGLRLAFAGLFVFLVFLIGFLILKSNSSGTVLETEMDKQVKALRTQKPSVPGHAEGDSVLDQPSITFEMPPELETETAAPIQKRVVTDSAPPQKSATDGFPRKKIRIPNEPAIIYPYEARRQGQQGRVWLNLILKQDGQVKDVKLERSSGYPILDEAALQGVRQWKLDPPESDSNQLVLPVTFKLNKPVQA